VSYTNCEYVRQGVDYYFLLSDATDKIHSLIVISQRHYDQALTVDALYARDDKNIPIYKIMLRAEMDYIMSNHFMSEIRLSRLCEVILGSKISNVLSWEGGTGMTFALVISCMTSVHKSVELTQLTEELESMHADALEGETIPNRQPFSRVQRGPVTSYYNITDQSGKYLSMCLCSFTADYHDQDSVTFLRLSVKQNPPQETVRVNERIEGLVYNGLLNQRKEVQRLGFSPPYRRVY
jgi:hypothetical protein